MDKQACIEIHNIVPGANLFNVKSDTQGPIWRHQKWYCGKPLMDYKTKEQYSEIYPTHPFEDQECCRCLGSHQFLQGWLVSWN